VDRAAVVADLDRVEAQLGNVTTAIRLGGDLPTLVEELSALERQRTRLRALLKTGPVALPDWPRLEQEIRSRLEQPSRLARSARRPLMCTVAAGSWGGRRLSLAAYVAGTGAATGRPLPESANVGYPLHNGEGVVYLPRSRGCVWWRSFLGTPPE
jgi:hypothetical protein